MNRNKNWKRLQRRLNAAVLAVSLGMSLLPGTAALAEESAMGRYVESEVALPENAKVYDVVRLKEGGLRIIGTGEKDSGQPRMAMWDSMDGGESWEETAVFPDEYAENFFKGVSLTENGNGAGIMIRDAESEDFSYSHVYFDANGEVQETALEECMVSSYCYAGDTLFAMLYGRSVAFADPMTGALGDTLADGGINMMAGCGPEVLLLGTGMVQRYDAETFEPLARDEALETALFAEGKTYDITTSNTYPIVFAEDEEGRLCYATNQGIYVHAMDGSVVEQVVNGALNSLGDPSAGLMKMETCEQCFYVLCLNGEGKTGLLKYEYDPDMPAAPQKELTVYSLEDKLDIRQSVSQFQKQRPDIFVNYVVGMSGEDGVSASDAIRMLNTDILAGNGPDVLVLDGLSVDTYEEKGLLADLSAVVNEVRDSDGLLEQIAYTYQKDDTLPAVPTKFGIPVIAGDPELIGQVTELSSIETLAEQSGMLEAFDSVILPEILYPVCAGSWKNEDGTLRQDALTEYVKAVHDSYAAFWDNATQENREWYGMMEEYLPEIIAGLPMDVGGDLIQGLMDVMIGKAKMVFGTMKNMEEYSGVSAVNLENGACEITTQKAQLSDVFAPYAVLGVTSTSDLQEEAFAFVKYLLSKENQMGNRYEGFPVNRAAFDTAVSESYIGEGMSFTSSNNLTGEETTITFSWPTEEEQAKLKEIADGLKVRADGDCIQRQTVIGETRRCMNGEISVEEAVNSIMQKMNLYLAE